MLVVQVVFVLSIVPTGSQPIVPLEEMNSDLTLLSVTPLSLDQSPTSSPHSTQLVFEWYRLSSFTLSSAASASSIVPSAALPGPVSRAEGAPINADPPGGGDIPQCDNLVSPPAPTPSQDTAKGTTAPPSVLSSSSSPPQPQSQPQAMTEQPLLQPPSASPSFATSEGLQPQSDSPWDEMHTAGGMHAGSGIPGSGRHLFITRASIGEWPRHLAAIDRDTGRAVHWIPAKRRWDWVRQTMPVPEIPLADVEIASDGTMWGLIARCANRVLIYVGRRSDWSSRRGVALGCAQLGTDRRVPQAGRYWQFDYPQCFTSLSLSRYAAMTTLLPWV